MALLEDLGIIFKGGLFVFLDEINFEVRRGVAK
jgi:hypothetical protein